MINKNALFQVVNGLIVISGLALLFFVSTFWIGSQEQYNHAIDNSKLIFMAKKTLMSLFISTILASLIYIISGFVFKRNTLDTIRTTKLDFVIFLIVSVVTVLYNHF